MAATTLASSAPLWAAGIEGELELRVVDEDSGQLLPVRVHLKDGRGKPVKPPRFPSWHDHFVMPGKAVLESRR